MTNKTLILREFKASNEPFASEINSLIFNWHSSCGFKPKANEINDELVDGLRKAIPFWINLILSETEGFRNKKTNKTFHLLLKDVILKQEPIHYFGILCPSYKKGVGAIGFSDKPGNTTYRAFENLKRMVSNTQKFGINCKHEIFFADIAIERCRDLTKKQDWKDLEKLIETDKEISRSFNIKFSLLTEFEPKLKTIIGIEGKTDKVPTDPKALERGMWRDRQFYPEMFGWSIKQSEERTLIHAHSYYWQGVFLRKKIKNPVMIQSSNSYEKAPLYNGPEGLDKPCIIYPKKYTDNPPCATIPEWPIDFKHHS